MKKIREALDNRIQKLKINHKIGSRDIANKEILDIASFLENHILPLLPQPRTEQEVLKDFEKLGYEVVRNDDGWLELEIVGTDVSMMICKLDNNYDFVGDPLTIQEHKLLNELFECWGWL